AAARRARLAHRARARAGRRALLCSLSRQGFCSMNAPLVPENVTVLGVAELTRRIKEVVEGGFPSVWVSGEVSNLSRPSSGHLYLTLKDAEATLKTVVYRGIALRMKFDLRDGMEVLVRGRLNVYLPQGIYQLVGEE